MRTHSPTCKRGYFAPDGEHSKWVDGKAPLGVEQYHTASCETPEMNKAYALGKAKSRRITQGWEMELEGDEYVGGGHWVTVKEDQGPRYARAIVELIYGA